MTTEQQLCRAASAIGQREFAEADSLLLRLLASQPNNVQARWLMLQSLESQEKLDKAAEQLRVLLIHVRKDLPAIDRIAAHMRQHRYPLAPVLKAYRKYLELRPRSAIAAFNYAYNLASDAQFEAAIAQYERALKLGIERPEEVHLNIANIYMDRLQIDDKARGHLETALALNPDYASGYYNLGNLSEQQGDRQQARHCFEKCLQIDPGNASALARLAETQVFERADDPLLARLGASARQSDNADVQFALGKAYEQLGNFEMAWQHFSTGNELDQRVLPAYEADRHEAAFERIIRLCGSAWFEQYPGTSAEPVFICGMFRSGSTLLEQMMASHPRFTPGGEREFFPRLVAREFPAYPEGLDNIRADSLRDWQQQHAEQTRKIFGESGRLTDKRPDNFLYIGLIKAILPSARFIVTERDWRDLATSIFSVRLGKQQPYATSLSNTRHYIRLQARLVSHWQDVLGPDLMRVRYEDLVSQPQATMTELLQWLGETWDQRCLSFHELKNTVKTASVWQVRQPLHTQSIGRWKNYEPAFVDIFGADLDT